MSDTPLIYVADQREDQYCTHYTNKPSGKMEYGDRTKIERRSGTLQAVKTKLLQSIWPHESRQGRHRTSFDRADAG